MWTRVLASLLVVLAACEERGSSVEICSDPDHERPGAASTCNPLQQLGCEHGQRCGWIVRHGDPVEPSGCDPTDARDDPPVGQITCVPVGDVPVGGACTFEIFGSYGYSDCERGRECASGVCRAICDLQGGDPSCDAAHACRTSPDLFLSGTAIIAGVCEPGGDQDGRSTAQRRASRQSVQPRSSTMR